MNASTDTIRSFVERLQRDVSAAEPTAVIGIYDLAAGQWIVQPDRPAAPEDYGDEGWVARIHGSELLIDPDNDALTMLADFAQDVVIDETGKSWPDVDHGGQVVHLDPAVVDGEVRWAHRSGIIREIGSLPAPDRTP